MRTMTDVRNIFQRNRDLKQEKEMYLVQGGSLQEQAVEEHELLNVLQSLMKINIINTNKVFWQK